MRAMTQPYDVRSIPSFCNGSVLPSPIRLQPVKRCTAKLRTPGSVADRMQQGVAVNIASPGTQEMGSAAPTAVFSSLPSSKPPAAVVAPKLPKGPITGSQLAEMFKKFKRLQNGSDIRGIAIAGVPNEPVSLTPGAVFFIGKAFAEWLSAQGSPSPCISVGRDPRISGPLVESALMIGLLAGGATVHTFGLATTPCMFHSIVSTDNYGGAIMITASHMPFNSNGLKFFTADGGLEKTDISDLLQRAAMACGEAGVLLGEPMSEGAHLLKAALDMDPSKAQQVDYLPQYAAYLRDLIRKGVGHKDNYHFPLLGLKIVVDAGNGSGGFYAEQVLAPLGADIRGSQYLDPDGSFPNHIPNPEHPSAMAAGRQAVMESGADLGIVFDTDVDRSAIVDRTGREINSNRFIALMAAIVLRDHPDTTIVTDSVTSNGLTDFISKLGGKHFRYKRGYKNVISQGIALNNAGIETHLMMETSGHGAMKENYFLDDGAYLATQVVIELVRRRQSGEGDIGDLLQELVEPQEAREFRIRIQDPEHRAIGAKVVEQFHDWVVSGAGGQGSMWTLDDVNHEGWRINIDEGNRHRGWALLRQSLHDPLLVLNVESEVEGGVAATAAVVLQFFLQECQGLPLDLSTLRA